MALSTTCSSVRLAGTHATSAINQPIGNSHGTHGHNAMSKAGDVVINKIPVAMDMTADVYSYLLKHTREPEVRQTTPKKLHFFVDQINMP